MESQYEVLSPWAEADPVPLLGLVPRLSDLNHKKIGLFTMKYKHASARVQSVVEKRLKERFPAAEFIRYDRDRGGDFEKPNDSIGADLKPDNAEVVEKFDEWARRVDAVVGAVGD